jgi:excisionase family DNA binding protein
MGVFAREGPARRHMKTHPKPNASLQPAPPIVHSPYLNAREAIAYLRLPSETALYRLIREHRMPTCRRGRLYLFDKRELDAWLRGLGSALEMTRAHRKGGA